MKSVPLWCPQYSNVLIFSRPLPVVYFHWVPIQVGYTGNWYYPVGRCSTRTYTRVPDISYPISYPIGYPGSVLHG